MRRMVDDKEMITIDNRITALEQGGGGGGVDAYTKAESDAKFQTITGMSDYYTESQTDALLLTKVDTSKYFEDDDNPEEYIIKQPQSYGAGIQLQASRDDNHHPDYSNLLVTPIRVIMFANSANHGDNDDDYTGTIEVTDGYIDLDVTDGTNTTTLRIGSNSATLNNVQIATVNDIPTVPTYTGGSGISITGTTIAADNTIARVTDITNQVSTYTLALGANGYNFWFTTISAESGLEGTYTGDAFWTFVTKYARYASWYYENSSDTSGDNHKMCTIANPGQSLVFWLADGTSKVTSIPPIYAVLTVTKTN